MKSKLIKVTKNQKVAVKEDTQYVLVFPDKKSVQDYTFECVFDTRGVEAEIIGLYSLDKGEKLSLITIANHLVPNTKCDTKIKGVVGDNTHSSYIGKIIITKLAQQTSSFLEDAVLVLGENTSNRSDPILEIEADDVAASHGATTGRINEDHVYYLQSRGLSVKEARELIVSGFFESLLSEIVDDEVRTEAKGFLSTL